VAASALAQAPLAIESETWRLLNDSIVRQPSFCPDYLRIVEYLSTVTCVTMVSLA